MRLLTTTLLCSLALLAGRPACAQAVTTAPSAGAMRDILCEYGAISKTEHGPAGGWRKTWAQFVTRSAFQHGLVPVWDGSTGNHTFGLFDRKTGAQGHPDLIKTIVDAGRQEGIWRSTP
ncbi:MAG TPA: hypothetical protein VFY73_09315 [Ideonella sp.]|uniref:hypothetical protein n=1 Tax=Ideonella sp. TaxID=1929293 RepID=UPI002E303438|nr:hypothetical protein [Ideonella sp.]HEX5684223.1 hypothetical protein [Ideonella sp.]